MEEEREQTISEGRMFQTDGTPYVKPKRLGNSGNSEITVAEKQGRE